MSTASVGAAQPTAQFPHPRQQAALETGCLLVLGIACGVYLLQSLPSVLFSTGFLASALTLLAGVLLGLLGAAAALAFTFYRLTHPKPGSPQLHAAAQLQPPRYLRRCAAALHASGSTATAPGPTLPHATAVSGEFSGIVYTLPASLWQRTETVGNWPPTSDPNQGDFKAWEATLAQGTLVLRPIMPPPCTKPPSPGRGGSVAAPGQQSQGKQAKPGAANRSSEATKKLMASPPAAAPAAGPDSSSAAPAAKVGIPLDGCTLELVADGLKGRSEFIRRAPLLISHPRWNLLDGEPAFYLWADDPGSKQQWLYALGWWCQDSKKLQAVEAMYGAYCEAMRDRTILEYPELAPPAAGAAGSSALASAGAEGVASGGSSQATGDATALASSAQGASAEQRQGKRGWKGWGANKVQTMRRKMSERRRGGSNGSGSQDGGESVGGGAAAQPGAVQGSSLPPSAGASPVKMSGGPAPPTAAEVASLESFIDAKWWQSRKVQMPPAIPEAVVRSRSSSHHGSNPASPRAIPRPLSASVSAELGPGRGLTAGGGNGFSTPLLGSSPAVPAGELGGPALGAAEGVRRADASPGPIRSMTAPSLPPGSPLREPEACLLEGSAQQEQQQESYTGEEALAASAAGASPAAASGGALRAAAGRSAFALPEGLPRLLSPDYAVNAFIARLAFDLLRRPDFQEVLRARIQRQVSRLQRPDYIQALEVVGVECGGVAPSLRNWRALPQPTAAIWPQVIFDMKYQGAFTVTIEAKVDIRDAAAWGRLDQALTRLAEGKQRSGGSGSSGAVGGQQQLHEAASTQLVAEGEEGEYLVEPLSPDSPAAALAAADALAQDGDGSSSSAGDSSRGGGSTGGGSGGRGFMGGIRHQAAKRLRQLAESTAAHISRIPLRLSLTFSLLEGTMCAWVPPPPGNRLFYAFVAAPRLELVAKPELAGRFLKYSYHIARVSSWIEQRMRSAITKNIVFPGGGDIPLPPLLGLEHPNVADSLPALGQYMQQPKRQRQRQQQQGQQHEQEQEPERGQEEAQEEGQQGQQHEQEVQTGGGRDVESHHASQAASIAGDPPSAAHAEAAGSPATGPADATDASLREEDENRGVVELKEQRLNPQSIAPPPAAEAEEQLAAVGTQRSFAERQGSLPPPAAMAVAAVTATAAAIAERRYTAGSSAQLDELSVEPSFSLPSSQPSASAEAAAAAAGAEDVGSSEGHLISPRYGRARVGSDGAPIEPAVALDFRLSAATRPGPGRDSAGGASAWEAALSQEGSAEAPTPRFAGQAWQPARPQVTRRQAAATDPLGASLGQSQAGTQQQAQQQQQKTRQEGEQQAGQKRPGLQVRLSATRSLDPDFTTSAAHTGFGEAPPSALPDYSTLRRTLSARMESGGSPPGGPGSGRSSGGSTPEAVGASLGRSLAYLRRQSSLQNQHREPLEQASPMQQQQASPSQHQHQQASLPQQHGQQQQGTRPSGGVAALADESRRVRQQGSFKEQAGKFFKHASKQMNAAGKVLASQVKEMQQQRAANAAGLPRSGSGSVRSVASPGPSPGRSEQQEAAPL